MSGEAPAWLVARERTSQEIDRFLEHTNSTPHNHDQGT